MYIQGIIENKDVERKALAVPEEGIQNLNGKKAVFILEEENVFSVRHIKVGDRIGNKRIITAGLEKGEKVVDLLLLLLAKGPGAEIQRPPGMVVAGGLLPSTLLTLIILPLVYQALKQ